MGLVDKLKNIFTEEVEEEEIKVEQIKKEVRSVPIESPSVERVRTTREEKNRVIENAIQEETVADEKAKSPVFFTDRDFEDLVAAPKKSRERTKAKVEKAEEAKKEPAPKPYGGNYSSTTIVHKEKQIFRPTPIISPVYGVLDKNYHKEDIVDKSDNYYDSIDGLSVDSIRNKAYGTLEDDLKGSMTSKPVEQQKESEENMDLFDELEQKTEEPTPKVEVKPEKDVRKLEEITIDLTKELDNLLLQKKEKEAIEKLKLNSQDSSKEKEETSEKTGTEKEDALAESDLFHLIDSMYEEGEEE